MSSGQFHLRTSKQLGGSGAMVLVKSFGAATKIMSLMLKII